MEVDDIQGQGCKFPRIGNSSRRNCNYKIGNKVGDSVYPDGEEDGADKGDGGGGSIVAVTDGNLVAGGGVVGLFGWPSSRIVRVSRASGGKDRHSKVLTSKGLRDRRVRLSVGTAIQFYDLQDRLNFDQPSKAVEWLLKAAAKSIDELPSVTTPFLETLDQLSSLSDEKRSKQGTEHVFGSAELELGGDLNYHQKNHHHHHHHACLPKSTCCGASETSKGSGLSLSRSESRIIARERAKERRVEKEREKVSQFHSMNPISQSSFTELLTAGINNVHRETNSQNESAQRNVGCDGKANLSPKPRQWSSVAAMDYFSAGLLAPSSSGNHNSSGFSGHYNMGNSLPQSMSLSPISVDSHPELQFPYVQDHLTLAASAAGGNSNYSLNSTISSGLAGLNRGTLQSNSQSLMPPNIQRPSSSIDRSNVPLIGTTAQNAARVESPRHEFPAGHDDRLQLKYREGGWHSGQKGKE